MSVPRSDMSHEEVVRHYRNVGRIAVLLASLEQELGGLIQRGQSAPDDLLTLISQSAGLERRVRELRGLNERLDRELDQLADGYRDAKVTRDRWAHSGFVEEWTSEADSEIRYLHPRSRTTFPPPSDEEVEQLALRIHHLIERASAHAAFWEPVVEEEADE